MVCGPMGPDAIRDCRAATMGKLLFVFTEFTFETGMVSEAMADDYVHVAMLTGCDGVQVPATRIGRVRHVRKIVGDEMLIISCGVGTQTICGQPSMRPQLGSLIAEGADYEIVGRAIYDSVASSAPPAELARRAKERILASCVENPGR